MSIATDIDIEYGSRVDRRADDILSSTSIVKGVDYSYLFPLVEQEVSWDDFDQDAISELLIWEKVSSQDMKFLEGSSE